MDITASEQERRADLVAAARRASELAGWRSDDTTRAVQDAYISGDIDLDDLVAQAQAVAGTARGSAGPAPEGWAGLGVTAQTRIIRKQPNP